jgi:hypothetical protein
VSVIHQCVADPIWGVCRSSYAPDSTSLQVVQDKNLYLDHWHDP